MTTAPAFSLGEGGFTGLTRAYGLAHFGKSLFWYASEILFAFFLTEVSGLSGHGMGFIFAGGLVASVGIDLTMSRLFRHTLADSARAGRLQFLGAVLSAGALLALFLTPWAAPDVKFALAAASMLAFRFAYALYDLPQNVLLSLASISDNGRTMAATMRLFFSGLATLGVAAMVGPLVAASDPQERAGRFLWLALGLSAIALMSAFGLCRVLRSRRADVRSLEMAPTTGRQRLWTMEIVILLLATFVVSLTVSVFTRLEPYFAAYVLKNPFWGGVIITAVALGTMLSQPLWAWLCHRWSRPKAFAAAAVLLMVSALAFLSVVEQVRLATVCAFLFGAASGGLSAVMWAAYGDAVAALPARRGGMAFALFTGASKIALALSGLMLGIFLQKVDYRGAEKGLLVYVMTLWPIAGGVICLGLTALWGTRRV